MIACGHDPVNPARARLGAQRGRASRPSLVTMSMRQPEPLPYRPHGLVVATYDTYLEAQHAVDYLSDSGFPVENGSTASTTDHKVIGSTSTGWLTTTDHKVVRPSCSSSSAALHGLVIRAELFSPGTRSSETVYNQMFTMHGLIMLLLFATPLFAGFANAIMPLQIGAPDVAFPRLNMFSYWTYLFGGLIAVGGFLTPGGAADFGWFAYVPLSTEVYSPQVGRPGVIGLTLAGLGTILGSVNFITTIITMRAPGMTLFRMPIFTWNVLVTSVLVIMVFPVLAATWISLYADRNWGTQIFDPASGGAILYQHLFWFFGHPEVYIIALPFFGIISEVIPVFSRKPIFGYKGLVGATLAIAALSMAVWAHHMYVTGAVYLPFFALMTMLIAVPTGVKFFNWIGTMWGGSLSFETPMLWAIGFLVTFLFGGLTGIVLASPPLDFHVSDSYFVVAHFHYVVFGTVVFAMFAGFYFWWPKFTGRMLDERLGKIHFWLLFVGFHVTFLIQHWLGTIGLPRRYADYLPEDGFTCSTRSPRSGRSSSAPRRWCSCGTSGRRAATPKVGRRRPVGLGGLAGVGDVLPAAAAQLHPDAADPFGAPGLRPEVPRGRGGRAGLPPGRRRPPDGDARARRPGADTARGGRCPGPRADRSGRTLSVRAGKSVHPGVTSSSSRSGDAAKQP
jgi:cytochrome c oxidase subunit I